MSPRSRFAALILAATIDLGLVAIGPTSTGGGCNYSAEKRQFVKDYRNQMAWSVAK